MCKKIIYFLVLVFILIPFRCLPQKIWTLDDCIAYALKNNLLQETQNFTAKIKKEQWRQSKRDMLPTIDVSYPKYNVSFGRTLDPVTNSFVDTRFVSGLSAGLSSSLTLFESFKKWHTLFYQKLIYESNKLDVEQEQFDLAFKIMNLFNSVLFQEGTLKIIKEQQITNLLHQKTIVKKVELGLVAKADLYEIEAATSSDDLDVLKAENALNAAKLELIQGMNLEVADINIVQDMNTILLDVTESLYIKTIFKSSQDILPSLQNSKIDVETAKENLSIKKTGRLPSIYFEASISTSYSDNYKDTSGNTISFDSQIKINQSKYIGFYLYYPIFNNGNTRSNINIAKMQLEQAEIQLKMEEQSVYKTIQELLQKNDALIAEEQLNLKKVKAKEKAYEIAQKKYEKKLINLYELQQASNSYLTAKIEQIRLMAQIAIQKRTLDFYSGKFLLPTLKPTN